MKKIIRLTESDLHNIVRESVFRILKEDGLGGATNCAGVYDTPSSTGSYEGGKAQSKEVTDYPIGGVIRKPSPVGKKTKKKDKNIIKPNDESFSREGGFSVGNAEWNVNEGKFSDALKKGLVGGTIGLASIFGGVKANAQNVVPQNNDTVQVAKTGGIDLGSVLRNKGYSDEEIRERGCGFTSGNIMLRNARGASNSEISKYLASLNNVSSSMSTDSIKVFNGREAKQRMDFLNKFNEKDAKKYKLFFDKNENAFLMPINYTLKDVQRELGIFQLSDFNIQ